MVIITGGGRGIGRQHARVFARAGARLVVNDTGGDPHGGGDDPAWSQAGSIPMEDRWQTIEEVDQLVRQRIGADALTVLGRPPRWFRAVSLPSLRW